MSRIIVFGAGDYGKRYIERMDNDAEIVAVADNDRTKKFFCGHKVISPKEIINYKYDKVVICLNDYTNLDAFDAMDSIIKQLHQIGVEDERIELQNVYYDERTDSRIEFIREYSKTCKKLELNGAVAECGVMRGHFAHFINQYFDTQTCYLFDTFSGLDERDIARGSDKENQDFMRTRGNLFLKHGDAKITLRRCPNKQNVIIKKGYIPDTFEGLQNERFVFVNLDMDLYAPTLIALRWFSTKMVRGGIILCHDYFEPTYPGIKDAVDEFCSGEKCMMFPVRSANCAAIMMWENI